MAPNDSAELDSTLPNTLDSFGSLMDNCKPRDQSNCGHPESRKTRPHMLDRLSSQQEVGNKCKSEHYKPDGSRSVSTLTRESQRAEDLERTFKAIRKLRNSVTQTKATNRVNDWGVESLNRMNPEKSLQNNRRLGPTDSYRKTMQELLKLHNAERDKWKSEREKWKLETDGWKLSCRKLKDEACAREEQLRKLTLESQQWKAECTRLELTLQASADAQRKKAADLCKTLLEQLRVEQQALDLQGRAGDRQKVSNHQAPTRKLERPSDRMSGHQTQCKSSVRNGKYNKLEIEDWVSQQQALHLIMERQRLEVQSAALRTAACEGKKLEEVSRDLLNSLDQRNAEIKCHKVELMKASRWHALAQQQIREQREEIRKLKKNQVAECIVCTNEFGEDPDRQRAFWKNCHHANICYKCTRTLWSQKSRQCPTCKTQASSMPTRLPPKIYL